MMLPKSGPGGLGSVSDIQSLIRSSADSHGVPQSLALAIAKQESGYNQSARGTSGEIGVFQLMPRTAQSLGVDPYDLNQNVDGAMTLLSHLLARYGDVPTAIAAYNAGETKVNAGIIPKSTQGYVASVLAMANLPSTTSTSPSPGPGPDPSSISSPDPGTITYDITSYPDPDPSSGSESGIGSLPTIALIAVAAVALYSFS